MPVLYAHRGFSAKYPENTMLAFREARKFTAHFELDIWLTADNEIVVHHDPHTERVFGQKFTITETSWPELKSLRASAAKFANLDASQKEVTGIPLLEEVLQEFSDCSITIECKHAPDALIEKLTAILKKTAMTERVIIGGYEKALMDALRAKLPSEVKTSASFEDMTVFMKSLLEGAPQKPACAALQIPPEGEGYDLARPELVAAAHQFGIDVHYWTINDPVIFEKLLDIGADGIMTDDVEMGYLIFEQRGLIQ